MSTPPIRMRYSTSLRFAFRTRPIVLSGTSNSERRTGTVYCKGGPYPTTPNVSGVAPKTLPYRYRIPSVFAGIVEGKAKVVSVRDTRKGKRVVWEFDRNVSLHPGQSVALDGACLTVEEYRDRLGTFFLSDETLKRTKLGEILREGYVSNYERSLKVGDRIDGHIVLGHVDGVARLLRVWDYGEDGKEWKVEVPEGLERYVAPKGSVALDGTSLTVNSVSGRTFRVRLIPHTLEITALGLREEGDPLNFEADVLARYVERLLPFLSHE